MKNSQGFTTQHTTYHSSNAQKGRCVQSQLVWIYKCLVRGYNAFIFLYSFRVDIFNECLFTWTSQWYCKPSHRLEFKKQLKKSMIIIKISSNRIVLPTEMHPISVCSSRSDIQCASKETVQLKKEYTLINYRYLFFKIVSLIVFKIETKKLQQISK